MKKIFTLLFAVVASVGFTTAEVYTGNCGAEGDGSNLQWAFNTETGLLSITGSGPMLDCNINYDKDTVAWRPYIKLITSISFPEGLTSIGKSAFDRCSQLASVNIPETVSLINDGAFSYCSALSSVSLPSSITQIGGTAFHECHNLPAVDNVRYAGDFLVEAVDKTLSTYTIKEGTKWIGFRAFWKCENLSSITLPNTVISIKQQAFRECTSLASINIPNSVVEVESSAFESCSALPVIDNIRYADTYLVQAVDRTLSTYTIKEGTRWIGNEAFHDSKSLKSIIIPKSVVAIGDRAFNDLDSLTSVTIPSSVQTIGNSAFDECIRLMSVEIPASVTKIETYAFKNVPHILYSGAAVGAPWGARAMNAVVDGWLVYRDNTKTELLTCDPRATGSINIPDGVTTIGSSAFCGCSDITSISIPSTVAEIGVDAFKKCTSLPVEDNIRYADNFLVEAVDKTLSTYTIKDGTKWIGNSAFQNCTNLTSITIPNSVTSLGASAFNECTSLKSITLPGSITEILWGTFQRCYSLESINIPSSVTTIGNCAFEYCNALLANIPSTVTKIGERAFQYAANITYSGVAEGAPWGTRAMNGVVDGWLVYNNTTKTELLACSAIASGEIVIPSSVTTIGDMAFYRCNEVTSVSIPNSVRKINDGAFYDCKNLKSVTIPNSVTEIGNGAFIGCHQLTSITLPESLKDIGYNVFDGWELDSIICNAINPPVCHPYILQDIYNEAEIYYIWLLRAPETHIKLFVPAGSVDAYKAADGWNEFRYILPIGEAEEIIVEEPQVEPTDNSVVVEWPEAEEAVYYTIQIWKNEELICTLTFNAQGQLITIHFGVPARSRAKNQARAAQKTTSGWKYTIGGLDPNTEYTYTVVAKRSDDTEVYNKTVPFSTKPVATGLDEVTNNLSPMTNKIIRDNQLLILRGYKIYTITGQEVK